MHRVEATNILPPHPVPYEPAAKAPTVRLLDRYIYSTAPSKTTPDTARAASFIRQTMAIELPSLY